VEGTADPSAALGMTKVRVALRFRVAASGENRRSLGCARDDKNETPADCRGFVCSKCDVLRRYGMYMHWPSQPLHEVIGWPGSGELHVAILQQLAGA
jgi:hypothetical protein